MRGFLVLVLALVASFPVFGRDTEIMQWTGGVFSGGNIPWEAPMFRCPRPERMTVKVTSSGGSFSGVSSSEYASWLEIMLMRQAQSLGPVRNITLFEGNPRKGDLLLEVSVRITSGQNENRNTGSSSSSSSWRRSSHSTSASGSDSREWNRVYLTLQPILYRIGEGGQKEIVAAPSARISASESEMTSSSEDSSYSRSDSYSTRRGSSYSSNSSRESSDWSNDEDLSREVMADGLVQKLSRQAISLVFTDLAKSLEIKRYGEIKAREEMAPPKPKAIPPARPANGGLVIEVTQ